MGKRCAQFAYFGISVSLRCDFFIFRFVKIFYTFVKTVMIVITSQFSLFPLLFCTDFMHLPEALR